VGQQHAGASGDVQGPPGGSHHQALLPLLLLLLLRVGVGVVRAAALDPLAPLDLPVAQQLQQAPLPAAAAAAAAVLEQQRLQVLLLLLLLGAAPVFRAHPRHPLGYQR
jgi:hypothetical protein